MDYFELIEDFIDNKLSKSEKSDFENEMKKNSSLKTAVQNHDLAKKIAGGFIEIDGQEIIDQIKNEKGGRVLPIRKFKWASIAAALVVLLGSIFVIQYFNGSPNYENLAASYYQDIQYNAKRGAELNTRPIDDAISLYHRNYYEESNDLFRDLFGGSVEDEKIAFYLAHIEFKNKNYGAVDSLLNYVQGQQFLEEGMYLKALNYLAQNKLEESKNLLTSIKNLQGKLEKKSTILLNKIDK